MSRTLRVAFAGTAHVHARDYVEACAAAASARRVVDALHRDGRRLHTGFFLRHEPVLRVVGARLAARRLGRLREVRMVPAFSRCSTRCARPVRDAAARPPTRRSR